MSIADGVVSGVTALRVELLCLQRPHLHSSGPQLERRMLLNAAFEPSCTRTARANNTGWRGTM